MRTRLVLSLFVISTLAACAADDVPGLEGPDDIDDSAFAADGGKADSLHSTATYYAVTRDARRCAWPDCGGFWVSRVNREWTRCHDGRWRNACYAVELDHSALGLDEGELATLDGDLAGGRVLVRGRLVGERYAGRRLGQFRTSEAWRATGAGEPSGEYYKITDRQLVCVYSPCPSLHEAKLNSTLSQDLHALDLARAGDEGFANRIWLALEAGPVLVAGTHSTFVAPLGGAPGTSLDATQVWTRITHQSLVPYAPAAWELDGRAFSDDEAAAPPSYPRTYRFDGATVTVEDAVAPCPAGGTCFWSGIVTRPATWTLDGDRVALAWTADATGEWDLVYPDALRVKRDAAGALVLVEEQPDGLAGDRRFRAE